MRDLGTKSMMRLTINDATDCLRFRNLRRRHMRNMRTRLKRVWSRFSDEPYTTFPVTLMTLNSKMYCET